MTLEELYKAVETFRKAGISLNDLEVQIAEKEKELINNKIIPELTDAITPILKQVCSELSLVVNYVPGQPLSVCVSRQTEQQEDLSGGMEQPVEEVPEETSEKVEDSGEADCQDTTDDITQDETAGNNVGGKSKPLSRGKGTKKGPKMLLRIKFADGTLIEEQDASETFCKYVQKVGVERVHALGIYKNRVNLVSDTVHSAYKHQVKDLGDGWYLMTWSDTKTKKKQILQIAEKLGIDITIEEFEKPKKK